MAWSIFGKKKKEKNPNEEIDKLHRTLEMLDKRERVLQKKIDQETDKAKQCLSKKNKSGAMVAMKRKKAYEEQVSRLNNQRFNIEQMQMKLEEATINMETYSAQRNGSQAIKGIYGNMTASKVDEEMDNVRDTFEDANEIGNAISESFDTGMGMDEDDLEDELNNLEQETLDEQMLNMKSGSNVPSHDVKSKEGSKQQSEQSGESEQQEQKPSNVDDELAALEADLNA
eukprot:gb/GECH01011371.1/.p1 GENE.gb/GECH01011371.1/~~gb/GECH01011371.1/.p1  ORF type:complete len:228 (+),score=78.38 gb/GECH01011371.1/:1-684(+)